MYEDVYTHIVLQCDYTEQMRDRLWCQILNISDVRFSVYLHTNSDFNLFHMLIGGNILYELSIPQLTEFRIMSINHVSKMLKAYYNWVNYI